jgi:uncharacterized protein YkwD
MKKLAALLLGILMSTSGCAMIDSPMVAPGKAAPQSEALAIQNHFRAAHHAPALAWDAKLANYAERHARKCRFQHSHSPYGENLAAGYPTITAAVTAWYNEQSRYSYWRPGFSSSTGHFTQLVWKSSKRVGCGYAVCNGKNGTPGKFWVCEYSPAGNVINSGYFRANVLPG